jgi:hypothetical protein
MVRQTELTLSRSTQFRLRDKIMTDTEIGALAAKLRSGAASDQMYAIEDLASSGDPRALLLLWSSL